MQQRVGRLPLQRRVPRDARLELVEAHVLLAGEQVLRSRVGQHPRGRHIFELLTALGLGHREPRRECGCHPRLLSEHRRRHRGSAGTSSASPRRRCAAGALGHLLQRVGETDERFLAGRRGGAHEPQRVIDAHPEPLVVLDPEALRRTPLRATPVAEVGDTHVEPGRFVGAEDPACAHERQVREPPRPCPFPEAFGVGAAEDLLPTRVRGPLVLREVESLRDQRSRGDRDGGVPGDGARDPSGSGQRFSEPGPFGHRAERVLRHRRDLETAEVMRTRRLPCVGMTLRVDHPPGGGAVLPLPVRVPVPIR